MSTWFSQCVGYGYITTVKEFERIVGEEWYENDDLRLENSDNGIGWLVTDDFAFFGKMILNGEDYGNDTLLAAESGYTKLSTVDASDFSTVCKNLKEMFGEEKDRECDYYILGEYN